MMINSTSHNPPFMLDTPIWTVRSKKITRVYYHRLKGARPHAPIKQPIFNSVSLNQGLSLGRKDEVLKSKTATLSAPSLKRSKRGPAHNDGFRPPLMEEAKMSPQAKKTARMKKSKQTQPFSFSTKFLDHVMIDRMISLGTEFPPLPIPEL
jgi:hypothetical protein